MCKIPSNMKLLFFGVLGLAPGHCSEKCEILQVRRDDQSRYHNLKPPSSLGSGWNEVHCPPADLVQIRNIQRPNRSFTPVQMFHTHTRPEPGQPWKARGRKSGTQTTGKRPKTAQEGEGNGRTSRTNLHGETDLTKTGHTPKPHDTLQGGTGEELRIEWGTSWWRGWNNQNN